MLALSSQGPLRKRVPDWWRFVHFAKDSDRKSETAFVDACEVTSGVIKEYDWGLDTATQVVWVANGAGVDRLCKLFLPCFPLSASLCSFKVIFRSRCAAGSYHPHGFGEDFNGSSGLHRRWSHLAENVHSVHCFLTSKAACWHNLFPLARPDGRDRSFLWKLAAQLLRQRSPEDNARSAGAVCARRVINHCASSNPTDLLPFERCQPTLGEVTSPSVKFVLFFSEPCFSQLNRQHPALFFARYRSTKVNTYGKLSFAFLCLETSVELCCCFTDGKCGDGVLEACESKVAPSLWTIQRPRRPRPPIPMLRSGLPLSTVTYADWLPLRFFELRQGQKAQGTNLVSWRTTDASTLPRHLVHELVLAAA